MSTGHITIDLDAIIANWRALDKMTSVETAAVVKADGYGLGAATVAKALAKAGARRFFVAVAEEGGAVRNAVGPGPEVSVFAGHMRGDTIDIPVGDMLMVTLYRSLSVYTFSFDSVLEKL